MKNIQWFSQRLVTQWLNLWDVFESLLKNNPWLINIIDKDLNILFTNWKLLERFSERSWWKCYEFLKWRTSICDDCNIKNVFETWTSTQFIINDMIYGMFFELSVVPIKDDDWKVLMVVQYVKDVTSNEKTKQELVTALNLAKSWIKTRDELLGNVSHELRTPLNWISGMLQLLMLKELDAESSNFVSTAYWLVSDLTNTVSELLTFRDIYFNKVQFKYKEIDFKPLIEWMLFDVRNRCAAKGIEFEFSYNREIPSKVLLDVDYFKIILNIFFSNAIRYTKQWKISFSIDIKEIKWNTIYLRFVFKDTGIWISSEYVDEILAPFKLWEYFMTKAHSWLWLWLSTANLLLEKMKWNIVVNSQEWVWSVFDVTIPFSFDLWNTLVKSSWIDYTEIFKDKKVLLVEPNIVSSLSLECSLKEYGCENLDIEIDSVGALERWINEQYDFLLISENMLWGCIIEKLRAQNPSKIIIVLLSEFKEQSTKIEWVDEIVFVEDHEKIIQKMADFLNK